MQKPGRLSFEIEEINFFELFYLVESEKSDVLP
jgi:hypothetical protein